MCEALSKYVRQFLALMRKNLLLKSRMWLSTILEIALPFIIILGLVGIHAATTSSYKEPASYDGLPPLAYPSGVPIPNARALSDTKFFSYNQSVYDFFDRILVPFNMRLSFIPNSGVGAAAADAFARTYPFTANYMHNIFGSEGQMEDYVSGKNYNRDSSNPGIYGAVVFKSDGTTNGIWDYNLRFNASSDYQGTVNTQDKSDFTDDLTLDFSSEEMNLYLFRGFAAVQGFVETFMINRTAAALGRNSTIVPSFQVTPFPTVGHKTDDFAKTVAGFLGLLFTLVYIWPVLRVAKVIIEEKELRIKEAMKIMGLSESALWVSWLVTYFLISLITTCLILAVTSSNIYKYSNKGYIFLLYLFFGMAAFSFAYMISAFFSRARVGATVAGILFLIIYFPYSAMTKSTSVGTKGLACLSAPIAFTYGVSIASYWESYQQGVTASNAATIEQNVNFSFSTALGMLFFDIVFYLLLGLYFDAVVPSKYGVSKPACFCFSSLFSWMKKKRRSPPGSVVVPSGNHAIDMKGKNADAVNNFEPVSEEVAKRVGVRALHLHKEFESDTGTGPVVAVNDFTLDMYEGQIFALLGHNGAGKTTVINMLTGMYGPTSGEAIIAGLSISNDLDDIRRNVGVCPQHDVLFDMLTVKEHLELFARIKGIPSAEIENEVMTMIADVGLTEKVHSKSAVLSGGQKRKLSVAIALLGGSKIVFLDEPTSGMDPYSRRSTWELLRKGKQNRVIILTTHFMDEADQLGDRIAIMAKGDVRCCGSPLFLKARYGVGYTLTLSKEVQIGAAQQEDKQRAQNEKLNQLVFSYVPRADILSEAAGEVAYRLPFDSTPQFAPLFRDLDSKLDKLGLQSYGISVTTLEEVFLRVGRDGDAEITSQRKPLIKKQGSWGDAAGDQPQNDFNASPDVVTPGMSETNLTNHNATLGAVETEEPSPWRHFKALIVKRWINSKRDRKVWFWQCLYPGIILLIGLGLLKASLTNVFPGFTMSTSGFNSPLYVPYNLGSSVSPNPFPLLGPNIYPPASNIRALGVSGLTSPRNMSNYLLANYLGQYKESKYLAYYYDTNGLTMFFNGSAIHGVPVVMNVYHNLLLQSVTGTSTASINLYNKAMPLTSSQLSLFRTFAAIFIGIAMAFIPSSIVAMVVREKETKAKHQQLISGVDVNAYWLSTYVWDVLNFIFPGFILIIILLIYQIDELIGENIGASIVITLLYALSVPSFTYMMSFFFTNHVTAQNMMLVFYIFTGPILLVASVILDIISSTQSANKVLKYFYRLFPHFCVGEAFTNLISRQSVLVYPDRPGPFAMDVTGKPLLYMGMEALGFFLIVLFIELVARTPTLKLFFEFGRSAVPKVQAEEDPDILQEKERVTNNSAEGLSNDSADVVQVRGLRKVYPPRIGSPPKVAVHDLWFGIPAGECFGFLGINGAGKTTTLQMLTGDELPTEGTAFLNGLDVLRQQKSIRRFVGYCPQFDALIDTLTARELLTMYCHIKGVRESSIPAYVESIIKQLSLSDFADKPCAGYSGGNKRKLSVGVALVGNPRIVFLDEPSTGMDPKSRRFLWDLISATMAGRSVILTTHSMEECEALCSRMGIMVGGRLRCLGSAQHLKHRYGDGYQIDLNAGANSTEAAVKFIMERVPGTYIIENHRNFSKLRVPKDATMVFPDEEKTEVAHQKLTLASLFEMMDRHHANLQISEYSISETTLEQIFIHFARQQEEETGAVAGFQSASPHQHNAPPAPAVAK